MSVFSILLIFLAVTSNFAQDNQLPECEWCGIDEAPDSLNWKTVITDENEPGDPLIITGTVFKKDGSTPASNIIIYVYHTNSKGIYPKKGDETGNGRRHGYLRSWLQTNKNGQYQITTIKPGAYPTRTEPAHIHMTIKEPDKNEYWIDSIVFKDDPLLTDVYKSRLERLGGSGIIKLTYAKGTWYGARNIILAD